MVKTMRKKILLIMIISLFGFLQFTGCDSSEANNENKEETKNGTGVYVKTEKVTKQIFTDNIYVVGVVKAFQSVSLSSEEGGRVKEIIKNKGSYVKQGDTILTLDYEVLKANMDAAKSQYDLANMNYEKSAKVYKDNAISEANYLQAKYQMDAAKANYDLAKARYERAFIKAPFSGYVNEKFVEVGEIVMPSIPLVSLINSSRVKVTAGVPENYINQIKENEDVVIRFKDLGNEERKGRVNFISKSINTTNRTFQIEIILDNSNGKIKPELNADVYIKRKDYDDVFIIPAEVITNTEKGYTVYVENKGIAELRVVDILSRNSNKVAVRNGLKNGDNLIVVGFQNLVNGEKVLISN